MDLFKFQKVNGIDIDLKNAQIVKGWDSLMWVERYRDPCEFTLKAKVDSRLQDTLPIGSLISHVNSTEVMIVENHEINQTQNETPEITITGRSFETFLENRIVGANQDRNSPYITVPEYTIPAAASWLQTFVLLSDHISATNVLTGADALKNVTVLADVDYETTAEDRVIKKTDLYSAMIELLEIDNLGIRTIRPVGEQEALVLQIHDGKKKAASVAFSYDYGDIESASYLWTNKSLKNAAYICGKWVDAFIDSAESGYDRRMMYVDASDIDNQFNEAPTGTDLTAVRAKMVTRGYQELAAQRRVAMNNVKPYESKINWITFKYRQDYQVGDIVSVDGSYNVTSQMRVIEYVEIHDENGESGYPTLAEP